MKPARCLLLVLLLAPANHAQDVLRVGMTVSDLDRSVAFYTTILDFVKESEEESFGPDVEKETGVFGARVRVARLRLGEETLELTEYLAAERGGRPIPADSRNHDRWFQHVTVVTTDMDAAYARLRQHRVRHGSTAPQRLPDWNQNAGGIRAFYFFDPDRHALEVIWFPAGKGDPRWQGATELFAGIDHTAIVVADTETSLAFYRGRLGLRVVGGSENYGHEQEHLNNVRGARLRITTLRGDSGPGVELLEYLSPRDGRPFPADSSPVDLWHWQTVIRGAGMEGLRRDPDGHAVRLVEHETP